MMKAQKTVGPLISYHHQLLKMTSEEKKQYRSKLVARSCMIISDTIFVQEKQWPNLFFNRKSALGIFASFQDTTAYIFGKLRLVHLWRTSQLPKQLKIRCNRKKRNEAKNNCLMNSGNTYNKSPLFSNCILLKFFFMNSALLHLSRSNQSRTQK